MPTPNRQSRRTGIRGLIAAACLLLSAYTPLGHAAITSLTPVQTIPTVGIYDLEPFSIDGTLYMAVANGYDGATRILDSKIYRWSGAGFFESQSFTTLGAMDWEHFTIGGGHYLAVANFKDDTTTAVNSTIYHWDGSQFVEYQSILTVGAYKFEFFEIDGTPFLAMASHSDESNYNTVSKLYQWDGSAFVEYQSVATSGATDWHHFTIDNQHFLAVSNFYNNATFSLDSMIYRWDGTQFVEYQTIPTQGGFEWESFTIDGEHFLAVANHRGDTSYDTTADLYRWNGTSFVQHQNLSIAGSISATYFSIGTEHYLAVGSHYSGTTYNTNSAIYRWDGTQFVIELSYPANGIMEPRVYTHDGIDYMAVPNNFDGSSYYLDTPIYQINATLPPLAEFTAAPPSGPAPLTVTLDASSASDPDGGSILDYQWSSSDAQSASGVGATMTFTTPGSYIITLTVTDDEGETAQQSVDIQVSDTVSGNCEGRASFSAADGRLLLPLMEVDTVPLLGAVGRPAGSATIPTSAVLRIIPGTTLFEIESVVSETPDPLATATCHASYTIDGTLTIPMVDVPVVTAIGGLTITTTVESYAATLELLPMSDLFTLTEIRLLP